MYCCRCNLPLHLSNTVGERLYGLASVLLIKCDNSACLATTDVHTGKRTPNGSYCINSKVAIGMTHAGMGPSHVNNFLTECNLPPISDTTLHKKEKEFMIHADNDAATTSKLKVDFEDLEKRDDQNHLKKGLSKSLHQMSVKYKELKQDDTREYILRCFMYAITGGTTEEDIKVSLYRIVPHIFGNHDSCREVTWCKYKENPTNFKYRSLPGGNPLTNESLKEELLVLVSKYTSRSNAISELGSTQANESFSQMASSKAPKSRLSAAVLQKNEGYSYLPKVNEASNLSPGDFTTSLTSKMDAKRKKRKQAANKKEIKKRRISLKKKKNLNERKSTVKEGPTYETQFELNMDNTENVPQIPQQIIISGSESRVFFDLETTGLGRNCEITQIAAKVGENVFQKYVIPRVDIQIEASRVTGITYSQSTNIMYVHGENVEPISIQKALLDFLEFLSVLEKPILIGHNICNFDIPILVRKLKESNLYTTYCKLVKGFVDTLKLARRVINKDEVVNYKQQTLVEKFLNISYSAHNAIEDVKSLQSLFDVKLSSFFNNVDVYSLMYHTCVESYSEFIKKKIITKPASVLLARHGVSFEHIKTVYNRDRKGVKFLFEEYKISQKIVNAINTFLDEE
ncbi:unnamed protein product [Mytilus coruscus]|uniref:Exonuclease domain-containing protein n=1 Tax=Mytilus coruscus TaxID=42192 RepID=A0A6J8ENU1_MYTCO|nr:unnamed protein product [Mytilus coruscus]